MMMLMMKTLLFKILVLGITAISIVYVVDPQRCVSCKNYRTHCSNN